MKNQTNNFVLTSKFFEKIIFFIIILMFSNAICQKTVSGKLLNQNKKPIEFAEVLLTTTTNKIISNQLSTENGSFSFSVSNGIYVLKVNQANYGIYTSTVEVSSDIDLGEIIITEKVNELNEINIVTKKKVN